MSERDTTADQARQKFSALPQKRLFPQKINTGYAVQATLTRIVCKHYFSVDIQDSWRKPPKPMAWCLSVIQAQSITDETLVHVIFERAGGKKIPWNKRNSSWSASCASVHIFWTKTTNCTRAVYEGRTSACRMKSNVSIAIRVLSISWFYDINTVECVQSKRRPIFEMVAILK